MSLFYTPSPTQEAKTPHGLASCMLDKLPGA
jgi:hypothetical protein